MDPKEKRLLIFVTVFGLVCICLGLLQLAMDFSVPGLSPIVNTFLWFSIWRLMKIRNQHPGGIWTFMYLLIIGLNLAAAASQIINAFA